MHIMHLNSFSSFSSLVPLPSFHLMVSLPYAKDLSPLLPIIFLLFCSLHLHFGFLMLKKNHAVIGNKNKAGTIKILTFKLYYKITVIKIAWYRHRNRLVDQWNRTEDKATTPSTFNYLTLHKSVTYTEEK